MRGVINQSLENSGDSNQGNQKMSVYISKKLFHFIWRSMGLLLFTFVITMIIKNMNSRSLLDSYNFDLKKANDISQRLSDVKGIDEILEEVENVIKMV
jgi:predicted nucleotidyltransferase